MASHAVISAEELPPGDHLVVELEGKEIGVYNVDGEYYAYTNWCAHQSGPVCEGPTSGFLEAEFDREEMETKTEYVREGEIVACPWHGWEFDLVTGECHSKPGVQLISHDVDVDDGELVVTV
ncbi:Rieske (2Fe-2S) protein [Halobellus clavatus]|jgi:nitrite reductase/ring-hydroxylating ferredoxin subunit|uniref:Ferredoxin subunit of nitrite reductase or a ring-hydroxylating dioxygenase n=1 Tax=Halobellus clavatus TaxID=660517 RepID=A0A1H3EEM1_9EURY|nr:Rieske 2Fe-2S domain-containing protein [Halobellus clavatus]SDX77173.1 Ferredoxin subunit of nitrite reductase or a ring-hydroxylating dioxygenase [Halobellus clavatus]